MEAKHCLTLELPKVLERLAGYASFSAGQALCRQLSPATYAGEIERRLALTREARQLLSSKADVRLGGVHDVRLLVDRAAHGITLLPLELLQVRDTLVVARTVQRTLARRRNEFPLLAATAARIAEAGEVIGEIERCIDDKAEVRDTASSELAAIRRDLRESHERLMDKLNRILAAPRNAPYLQEALVTQRAGRYVIPIKADFRGRIPGVVHDQSASGVTLFVEPLSCVEMGNRWREMALREQREVERVLAALSALVADEGVYITAAVEVLAELDLAFACAGYAEAIHAVEPRIVPFRKSDDQPGSTIQLIQARHPLLDSQRVVPIDVVLDEQTFIVVITGPNTGGKTVALKTVGLLCLMAYCGLHVPAGDGSAISAFEHIYADIGDEQSIEQNLSTFSAHMGNLISFLGQADCRSLVLLDELGAGTDPGEGAALARAMLEHLRARRVTTLVATHYPELKLWAVPSVTPGAVNASAEFDPDTLSPTYKLSIGLPGRSNAFAIAARLGLAASIVEAARAAVAEGDLHTEDLLAEIHRSRTEAEANRAAAERARREAEGQEKELRARLAGIEQERRAVLDTAGQEAQLVLDELGEEVRALRGKLTDTRAAELAAVEARRAALTEAAVPSSPAVEHLGPRHPLHVGDQVWVERLKTEGQILSLDGDEVEVQAGRLRLRLPAGELEWRSSPQPMPAEAEHRRRGPVSSPGIELDLRGQLAQDALASLERYLDNAVQANLPWVRIIHGHGTGALKRAVRQALRKESAVTKFEPGKEGEGGDGVTVAWLAVDN
ncbi:MAG: endonuclease MutS2 [Thermoflexales bacterium]|nr:endonuclease MutS2 [Thermoflexales bacterium]